jgi:hypothetical protein
MKIVIVFLITLTSVVGLAFPEVEWTTETIVGDWILEEPLMIQFEKLYNFNVSDLPSLDYEDRLIIPFTSFLDDHEEEAFHFSFRKSGVCEFWLYPETDIYGGLWSFKDDFIFIHGKEEPWVLTIEDPTGDPFEKRGNGKLISSGDGK